MSPPLSHYPSGSSRGAESWQPRSVGRRVSQPPRRLFDALRADRDRVIVPPGSLSIGHWQPRGVTEPLHHVDVMLPRQYNGLYTGHAPDAGRAGPVRSLQRWRAGLPALEYCSSGLSPPSCCAARIS